MTEKSLASSEVFFPLRVLACTNCWLVQTEDFAQAKDLFSGDYAYFSSVSLGWLAHSADYSQMITQRLALGESSFVIEVAANDGYLLKNFVHAGIPCLGIEPTASTAEAAERAGVPVLRQFFGLQVAYRLASQGKQADLIIGNNVFAHVPDINDFSAGLKTALKPDGVITLEFPHLMRLVEQIQFDTIYHEHFSYLSLHAVINVLSDVGLRVWDVEQLQTHGGSLRVYICHTADRREDTANCSRVLAEEVALGLTDGSTYSDFQRRADRVKDDFLQFLVESKRAGKTVAAYGAAAKGNTLLNYAGVKPDLLPYVCDAAPSKQGKYLPGSRIPVLHPNVLKDRRPDYVIILPWNIADEITAEHAYARDWGARFWVAIPHLREVSA